MADSITTDQEAAEDQLQEADIDFRRMRKTHEVAGYREGIEEGKEACLQQGFNQGFGYGVHISLEWGKLRGFLSALLSLTNSKAAGDSNNEELTEIVKLIQEVDNLQKELLNVQTMLHYLESNQRWDQQTSKAVSEPFKSNLQFDGTQGTSEHKYSIKEDFEGKKVEMCQAFEMLHTDERTSSEEDWRGESETRNRKVSEREFCSVVTRNHNAMGEATHSSITDHLEKMWTRILSLAEKIGINRQKVIMLKSP